MRSLAALVLLVACSKSLAETAPEAYTALRLGDFQRAFTLFTTAAEEGYPEARFQLGKLYLSGRGTVQNKELARHWLQLAAADGVPGAQYALGLLLLETNDTEEEGLRWLRLAAESGQQQAADYLEELARAPEAADEEVVDPDKRWLEASANCRVKELVGLLEHGADPHSRDEYHRNALHYMVMCNNLEGIRLALAQGLAVNTRDRFGESPIKLAVKRGSVDAVALMLSGGSETSLEPGLLHLAVSSGSPEMLATLLSATSSPDELNDAGETPLELAHRLDNQEAQRALLAAGARPLNIAASPTQGATPWETARRAVLQKRPEVIAALVREYSTALLGEEDSNHRTLLMYAVEASAPSMIQALLELGAEVDQQNSEGQTALTLAAGMGNPAVIPDLLMAGADPLRTDGSGNDAIQVALDHGRSDQTAAQLLKHVAGTELSRQRAARYLLSATRIQALTSIELLLSRELQRDLSDSRGRTSTWYAARNCDDRTLASLLSRSHSPSAADTTGRTPLHQAAESGCASTIKLLLKAGADVTKPTQQGNTALMLAVRRGQLPATRLLLDAGSPATTQNSTGDTPLILAVRQKSAPLVSLLLEHGADPYRRNELGISALDLANQTSDQLARQMTSKSRLPF